MAVTCLLPSNPAIFHGGSQKAIDDNNPAIVVVDRGGDLAFLAATAFAGDPNRTFSPRMVTRVQTHDGFTLRIAFASTVKFFYNNGNGQWSPCDVTLVLSNSNSQICVQTEGRRDLAPHGQFLFVRHARHKGYRSGHMLETSDEGGIQRDRAKSGNSLRKGLADLSDNADVNVKKIASLP